MSGMHGRLGAETTAHAAQDGSAAHSTAPGQSMTQDQLDTFLSMVAHDLRAPLQAISSFTEILIRQYEHTFPEEALNTLEMILDSAQHAGSLIEALMRLSMASRQPLELEPLSPAAIVADLAQQLQHASDGFCLVQADTLPACRADQTLVRQVFRNLLENACKFGGEEGTACAEVGGHVNDGHVVYWVRDNGPGVPEAIRERLFLPFVRHKGEHPEHQPLKDSWSSTGGNGIGLAIVQRVAERHGGRAWVECPDAGGSVFYFSLLREPGGGEASASGERE